MFATQSSAAPEKAVATPTRPEQNATIQRKPKIEKVDDPLEREADRIADEVLRAPAEEGLINTVKPQVKSASVSPEAGRINLQKSSKTGSASDEHSGFDDLLNTTSQSMDPDARLYFEKRLGYDFSQVRVHTDQGAAEMACCQHARAYTQGRHIVFGAGEYAPRTTEGRRLLAHELTHVIQQSLNAKAGALPSIPNQSLRPIGHGSPAAGVIQRKDDPTVNEQTKTDKNAQASSNNGNEQGASPVVKVIRLDFAFVFPHDAYGEDAKRYIRTFYPHHKLVEVRSLEEMIDSLWRETSGASETHRVRVREIIIVTHGNAAGGMTSVSLMPGGKAKFSPPEMATLQQQFRNGLYQGFQQHRTDVISRAIDENTHIEIKGCRIGQSEEALDAFRSFMGGEATVTAPTMYQGFDVVKVPGPVFKDVDAAYDTLIASHFDLPEKLVCRANETKAACLNRNFPDGQIPAQFFVTSDEGKAKFKAIQAKLKHGKESLTQAQVEGEPLKHRDQSAAGERSSRPSALGQVTQEDSLPVAEIEREARALLANYRPERAYILVSLRRAWMRKKLSEPMSSSLDPMEGLPPENIFGDSNIVGPDASRYPGPTAAVDPFSTDVPGEPVKVSPEEKAAYAEDETRSLEGSTRVAPTRAAGATVVTFPTDKITPESAMPRPALAVDTTQSGARKADTALVARGDFARTFEIKYERQRWYLKVKKATVDLNGKIDFKGEGEKEIVLSALGALTSKPGETVSTGGVKGETTLAKGTDEQTGVSGKATAGLSIGGQERTKEGKEVPSTQRGMKAQLFLKTQVSWGPIAQELTLTIVGIDETKSGTEMWTVLGIDWSPIVVTRDFELPVSDGTKVRFSGTVRLTISAEPDWVEIAARLSQFLGRQVVTEDAIVAGGTAAAAGADAGETATAGATGAGIGELVIAGGFIAGGALSIYAYFKATQDIQQLTELQRAAGQGVEDFCGGYLAHLGISGGGRPGGALSKEGERHGEINLKARVARAARAANKNPKAVAAHLKFSEDDPEVRAAVLRGVTQDAQSWRRAVYLSYETAVRTLFFREWERQSGEATEGRRLEARARAGLSGVDLADQPDYAWVNAVGSQAAAGMRLPANVR